MDSNTKGYSCHCQSTFDPATDCLTREKELLIGKERQISAFLLIK